MQIQCSTHTVFLCYCYKNYNLVNNRKKITLKSMCKGQLVLPIQRDNLATDFLKTSLTFLLSLMRYNSCQDVLFNASMSS